MQCGVPLLLHVQTNEQPALSLIAMQLGEWKKKIAQGGAIVTGSPLGTPLDVMAAEMNNHKTKRQTVVIIFGTRSSNVV